MITEKITQDAFPRFHVADSMEVASKAFLNDPIDLLTRAYRECGPVCQMVIDNEWRTVVAGVEANDIIWRNPANFSYGIASAPFLEEMGSDHVSALDGDHHKEKKKVLKPAFSMAGAMRYLAEFNTAVVSMLESLDPEETVELSELWARMAIRVNSETVAITDLDDEMIVKMSDWERRFLSGLFRGEQRHAYFAGESYVSLKAQVFKKFRAIIDERLDAPSGIEDNLAEVIKARAEIEDPLDRDHLVNDLYFVLLAGVHNTSALINACLHLISSRPDWLAALREEVDAWDGQSPMALQEMPRLKATIMEAQRLIPPVNLQGKYAHEDFEIGDYLIPAKTHFYLANTVCHFLEEYYEEPNAFKPERFVEEGKFVPKTFGFFGGGIHLCLGRNHSLLQAPVVLAHVLKGYELDYEYEPPLRVVLSRPRRPVDPDYPCKIRRR